ncbi:MAG: c-type cytochrome [Planctomycetota bacterium]
MKSPIQWLLGLFAAALPLSCSLDESLPKDWVLNRGYQQQLATPEAQQEVLTALETLFGTALAPHWPLGDAQGSGAEALAKAAADFRAECTHCHGLEGYGNGPSSVFQNPKPWNFGLGVFPRTAPGGGEPRIEDLMRLLHDGIGGSAMPAFARLGEDRLRALAGHVLLLARRSAMEQELVKARLAGEAGSLTPEAVRALYETWEQKRSAPAGSGH